MLEKFIKEGRKALEPELEKCVPCAASSKARNDRGGVEEGTATAAAVQV